MARRIIIFVFILSCIGFCVNLGSRGHKASAEQSGAASDAKQRILILPFSIRSDSDLAFLQQGIAGMLRSRLSLSGKTELIGMDEMEDSMPSIPESIDQAAAFRLGEQAGADYVLMGNLTILGESVSTDAALLDMHSRAPRLKFSKFGENRGDAIAHINLFANQINERVFGYRPVSDQSSRYAGNAYGNGGQNRLYYQEAAPQIWKSRKFKTQVIGLAVGDVDGDGKNETVFADEKTIFIYRFDQNAFNKIAEFPGSEFERIIGIDICDVNKNGKAEIFVSNTITNTKTTLLRSFVLEWENGTFREISQDQNWFFRTIRMPERGNVLLGQKKGFPPKLFSGDIHEITFSNGDYADSPWQGLPDKLSLWGFAYGDILHDGLPRIITYTGSNQLTVLKPDGSEEWTSSEIYGGSPNYVEYPAEIRERDFRDATDHYYLPQRIHIVDFDGDGKNEIFVVNNHEITNRLFERFRSFDYGYVECLFWNTLGLQRKWKTQKISGYISDFTIADLNNDSRDELVFCAISKGRNLLSEEKSYIVSYTRNQSATPPMP